MSGHSKWHKIKHQKETADKKKGQVFGKFAREIVSAARSEKDPAKNATLRDIIARAKKANMPQENIDRLLDKADKPLESALYEGFGPEGVAILVATETDNSNRTVSELRLAFNEHGGRLGERGSVAWKFRPSLYVQTSLPKEPQKAEGCELALIEAGAEDITMDDETISITAKPTELEPIKQAIGNLGLDTFEEKITFVPLETVSISPAKEEIMDALLAEIEGRDDVVHVYTNLSLRDNKEDLQ